MIETQMMSPKTAFQLIVSLTMIVVLGALLYWQEERYALVRKCEASGGQWDGAVDRCRPFPKIYIERNLKRS